jgi:transglutaminase-like putative cysteine protease
LAVEPEGVCAEEFLDAFGNRCARVIAPPGTLRIAYDNVFQTSYDPEPQPDETTLQEEAGALPVGVLPFLLGSRYCEIDRLSAIAWDLFGKLPPNGLRPLAINRWVFEHVRFGYRFTRPNKTALDTFVEGTGVCRDMTHLAIAFCRSMNIPARYATGYLADIDADPDPTPMDFSAFYEVYIGGRWWPMDARHGRARIGRVLMARGRDATDVALVTSFGRHKLTKFSVITEPAATLPLLMPAPAVPLARSA